MLLIAPYWLAPCGTASLGTIYGDSSGIATSLNTLLHSVQ